MGETKLVTSITGSPVFESMLMNWIFASVGTNIYDFDILMMNEDDVYQYMHNVKTNFIVPAHFGVHLLHQPLLYLHTVGINLK